MNNFKYYNDSLAYDFELFMPREKNVNNDNVIKMPQKKTVSKQRKAKAQKTVSVSVAFVLLCTFFLAAICGNIYLRIRINEVDSQINDTNVEINEKMADHTKLFVQMEKIISYNNLEKSAETLGMKKMDKEQVVYIHVNDRNTAITSDGELVVSDE